MIKELRLKSISAFVIVICILLLMPSIVALALANPDAISFGTGATAQYKVFYNVLETGDWLVAAEGYVYYYESAYETLRPDGAGSETNLSPSAGANWQCVSDSNDATYVTTNSTTYVRDLYSLSDSTVSLGTITNVGLYFRIKNSGAGTTYGIPEIYIGGNNYNGSSQTATTAWMTRNEIFSYNPATSVAWTWNDIDNMEVGVSIAATAANASCSEVWVVVSYTREDPGLPAEDAFLFELLNSSGNVTYASTHINDYGDRPISLYLTASQVTTAGLTVGGAYMVRIAGNPLVFASPVGNTVNATLGATDYVDQELGDDGGIAVANNLRNFMIKVADNIENYDNPPSGSEYIVTVQGVRYLSVAGTSIFLEGVPSLNAMCPILFQYSVAPMEGDEPESTGAYGSMLTPLAKWGNTVANGLTNLGLYLGVSQQLAGSIVLLVLAGGLAIYVYSRTQSGIAVLLLIGTTPFLGSWLGLMPMALAFIFTIVIVVLMGYYFFSRGAL